MTYQFDPILGAGRDGDVLPAAVRTALSADADAGRTALGLGTAATTAAADYATAAQGAKADAALLATADAIADVLEAASAGAPADLARIQSAVSEYVDLRKWGAKADGITDCRDAFVAAYTAGMRYIYLATAPGESGVAYFSNWDDSVAQYCKFDFRVSSISLPFASPAGDPLSAGAQFVYPVNALFRSTGSKYKFGTSTFTRERPLSAADADTSTIWAPTAANYRSYSTPYPAGSGVWTATSNGGWPDHHVLELAVPNDSALHYYGLGGLRPGDEMSWQNTQSAGTARLLAMCRSETGYDGIIAEGGYGTITLYRVSQRGTAAAVETPIAFTGASVPAYSSSGSTWTLRLESWTRASLRLNGYFVGGFDLAGPALDMGIAGLATAASQTHRVRDVTVRSGADPVIGRPLRLLVSGDSRTAPRQDSWPGMLREILDYSLGGRVVEVTNIAVAGAAAAAQKTALLAQNLSGVDAVLIDVGTNNAQSMLSSEIFKTDLTEMVNYVKAAGAKCIVGCMSPWYEQGQSGGTGVASSNSGKTSAYRAAAMRVAANTGVHFVDGAAIAGPVLPHYVNAALTPNYTGVLDSAVYDNIHPTTRENYSRAVAYARKIVGTLIERPTAYVAVHEIGGYKNGWSWIDAGSKAKAQISASRLASLSGTLIPNGGPTASGTLIMTLPRYLWPAAAARFTPVTDGWSSNRCILTLDTNGDIKIYSASAVGWVDISCILYNI